MKLKEEIITQLSHLAATKTAIVGQNTNHTDTTEQS